MDWNNGWIWQSDWNGDELGYDHILIVGLYQIEEGTYAYVNTETGEILEQWEEEEEDE